MYQNAVYWNAVQIFFMYISLWLNESNFDIFKYQWAKINLQWLLAVNNRKSSANMFNM